MPGKGYYINEDFSKETAEIRKENWKKVKKLRKNGKYAILVYDKVFWREKRSLGNTPKFVLMFRKNLNFEKLCEYLSHVKRNFSVIALTETWCSDDKVDKNSLWQLPNYAAIHQIKNSGQKGGGIALCVHNSLNYEIPKSKNINNNDIECLNIEIVNKTSKSVIISCIYRLPRGDDHKFLDETEGHVIENKFQEKPLFLVSDLNINSLAYSRNTHVRDFFNFVFQNGIFPVINKATRLNKSKATIIDHILTNTIIDHIFKVV